MSSTIFIPATEPMIAHFNKPPSLGPASAGPDQPQQQPQQAGSVRHNSPDETKVASSPTPQARQPRTPSKRGLTVDVSAPHGSSPQPSAHVTDADADGDAAATAAANLDCHCAFDGANENAGNCAAGGGGAATTPPSRVPPPSGRGRANSRSVSVPTPSRRAQRKVAKQEVVFDFESGQEQRRDIAHDLSGLGAVTGGDGHGCDDALFAPRAPPPKGRRGYLAGLLHASMGPRGNLPGAPAHKQRAQTDEDGSSERQASRSRLLEMASAAAPAPPDSASAESDALASERRRQTKLWRGRRSATDEYAMVSRYNRMYEVSFSWRQCLHCQFQYLLADKDCKQKKRHDNNNDNNNRPPAPVPLERSTSAGAAGGAPSPAAQPARARGQQQQQQQQQSPQQLGRSVTWAGSLRGSGGDDDGGDSGDEDDTDFDEFVGVPKFSHHRYCSPECYWSAVFINERRYQ